MAFFKGGKTETETGEPIEPGGDLRAVAQQLGQLGRLLGEANEQLAQCATRQEPKPAVPVETTSGDVLRARLDEITAKLDQLLGRGVAATHPSAATVQPAIDLAGSLRPVLERLESLDTRLTQAAHAPAPPNLDPVLAALQRLESELAGRVWSLQQAVENRLGALTTALQPPKTEEGKGTAGMAEWQRALLGPELAGHAGLAFQRKQLLDGVLAGDAGACGLAGQLLVFQATPPEKMPQVLKDIGEAYYRWQPKTTPGATPLEEALVHWLEHACDAAGISNRIELVHPGQRFDAARHTALTRGVEITEVLGWIVLRDNGRVYTKAAVGVR